MLNLARKIIDTKRIRTSISSLSYISKINPSPSPEDLAMMPPENVLILAPHPDDEIIGCGGTIIKHRLKGSKIWVIYMTDGRDGNADIDPKTLSDIRKNEAKAGLRVMGCSDYSFMNYPDRQLCEYINECAKDLKSIISDFKPNSIFVPNFFDAHIDHAATANILAEALKNVEMGPICYSYEVWTTILPNTIIDISEVMTTKLNALREHKSQLSQHNYVQSVEGLNSYRSIYCKNRAKYCEAFFKSTSKVYIKISEQF